MTCCYRHRSQPPTVAVKVTRIDAVISLASKYLRATRLQNEIAPEKIKSIRKIQDCVSDPDPYSHDLLGKIGVDAKKTTAKCGQIQLPKC